MINYHSNDKIETVTVHEFSIGDVEDPDLFASYPLLEWQNSEIGKWIIDNSIETPVWHRMVDLTAFGYRYKITAKFKGAALTEYLLRK